MPGRIHPLAQYLMVLALMIGAYSAYARFAVPMIKGPENQVRRTSAVAPTELTEFNDDKSRLLHLLPAAAWELGQSKTLFTSQGTLLFQEMERLDDEGNYSLKPFSMILNDHGSGSAFALGLDPNVPPTVLRCGEAKLKFDGPILLTGGSKTRMQAALLSGEVTIFRPSLDPQKNETLKLITQNVQVNANRIFTLGEVAFSFGPHRGSGKNLTMELTHEVGSGTVNRDFSTVNGVSTVKLATLNSLLIEPASMESSGPTSPTLPPSDALPTTPAAMFSAARVPVEIFCKGPFEFDYLQRTATFNDRVYVVQKDSFGDNLNCETLVVEFASKEIASNDAPAMGAASIGLKRLRAIGSSGDSEQGKVVTLIANSRKMKVTGGELTYDATDSLIRCSSDRQVTIASPELNVKARELSYWLSTDGSLGDLDALGPGEFFRKAVDPKENLFTRWQNKLTIRRRLLGDSQDADANQMAQKLIVIDGNADVLIQETTHVTSDQLNISVFEIATVAEATQPGSQTQPSKSKWQYLPAEIFADDDVTIRSPNLDGEAGKLLVTWPRPNPDMLKTHQTLDVSVGRDVRTLYTTRKPQTGANQNVVSISPRTNMRSLSLFDSPATAIAPAPAFTPATAQATVAQMAWQGRGNDAVFDGSAEPKAGGLKQYVRFKGDEVRLKLDGAGDKAELLDLKIDGNVIVHQYENRGSEKKPLRISGDSLRVVPQGEEIFRMLVAGVGDRSAIVDAQGLLVSGAAIHLDQESNKVWVDGAGEMKVRQTADGETSKPPKSSTRGSMAPTGDIDLQWAGGMVFDGAKIYFERNVMMTSFGEPNDPEKSVTKTLSQALSIALAQKVNFQKLSGDQSIGEVKMAEMVLVNHIPESMRVFKNQDGNTPTDDARFNTPDAPIIFQNETFGPTGKLVQQRRIAVPQATINAQTNTVVAAGPGKIFMHVVPAAGDKSSDPTAQTSGAFGGLSALSGRGRSKDPNEINFLQVNFEQQLVADLTDKQLEISGNVRTAFAPVKRFSDTVDPDGKQRLPEGAVRMQCAKILLSQWQPTGLAKVQNEMVATGNVHITSAGFDSVSERLSYNDRNDQLVIEGTARSPAQLFHRPTPRSEKQQMLANKIIYHPSTGMAETQGVQSMNMNVGQ